MLTCISGSQTSFKVIVKLQEIRKKRKLQWWIFSLHVCINGTMKNITKYQNNIDLQYEKLSL